MESIFKKFLKFFAFSINQKIGKDFFLNHFGFLFMRQINIGCGSDIKSGWMNLDLFPMSDEVIKFDVTNQSDLDMLSSLKCGNILCSHLIGYINRLQAINFLKSCYYSLEPGGRIVLEFPDIVKIAKVISNPDIDDFTYHECIRAIYAYDVTFIDEKIDFATYIFGYSSAYVCKLLDSIGFINIVTLAPLTHEKRDWRDSRIEAFKP